MSYIFFKNKAIHNFPNLSNFSYTYSEKINGFEISIPDGELIYIPNFLDETYCENLFLYLTELHKKTENNNSINPHFKNINWLQPKIKIFGKEYLTPRLTAWHGDEDAYYSYSGLENIPNPWNSKLLEVKEKIEEISFSNFNSVLLNWYRNGNDSMGLHSDNEKELGRFPIIASLSIGEERDLIFKHNKLTHCKIKFKISNGSLLIMKGLIQEFWKHAIPKQVKIQNPRINLTFRKIEKNVKFR